MAHFRKNDEWAYMSGCKTFCINPENVDIMNREKWNKVVFNVDNLLDILHIIEPNQKENKEFIK